MEENILEHFTNLQLLALREVFDSVDLNRTPDLEYAGLWDAIEHIETDLRDEMRERGL